MNEIRRWEGSESLPMSVEIEVEVEAEAVVEPAEPGRGCAAGPDPEELAPPPIPPRPTAEQRVSQRYPALAGRSWLGWYEGGAFRQTAGWILNISASGALVATDVRPPAGPSVWLRLEDSAVAEWAEVRVIGVQDNHAGIPVTRLVFRGTCPYAMMKTVAFDSGPGRPPGPESSPSWGRNSW
jgi:hypothetical protein